MNKPLVPLVGILMGSDSDLPIMQEAAKVLEEFGIGHEVHTLSAHRTPGVVVDYVQKSEAAGYKVFICGAGGAAHLAGVVAAHSTLPVIGVPLVSKSMNTGGLDALYSTVQMPPGIPVATVAINGAKNAGILAAQIIGSADTDVRSKLAAYKGKMAEEVKAKDEALQQKGIQRYLEDKGLV